MAVSRETLLSLLSEGENLSNFFKNEINECKRIKPLYERPEAFLQKFDNEFDKYIKLNDKDIDFLAVAVVLQALRIILANILTKIEPAGLKGGREDYLHDLQDKIFNKKGNKNFFGKDVTRPLYASYKQIITTNGVPYDAQSFFGPKYNLFTGGNHRYATLGHDPLLGLIFGTGNILTNTITCSQAPFMYTHHVIYTIDNFDTPKIAQPIPTLLMLHAMIERLGNETDAFVAALIKQVIHIGTDLYTPKGIQLPGLNLVLSVRSVSEISRYVTYGDVLKAGLSYKLSVMIDKIISIFHQLTFKPKEDPSREILAAKTQKILLYSNAIATGTNVIWVGANLKNRNISSLKNLDIGGLMNLMNHLITTPCIIEEIKRDYVFGKFKELLWNRSLDPNSIVPEDIDSEGNIIDYTF